MTSTFTARRTASAGSPLDRASASHGNVPRMPASRRRAASSGFVAGGGAPARAHQRHVEAPQVRVGFGAWSPTALPGSSSAALTTISSTAVPLGRWAAQRSLAAAVAGLVLGALGHRPAVDLDELVDEPRGRRAGAGDHRGARAVDVDRGGGQRGDGVLVEVAADDDARAGRAEPVELGARLVGEHPEITGVDADRAQCRAGGADGVLDARGDVVGVDEQRRRRRPGWRPGRGTHRARRGTGA